MRIVNKSKSVLRRQLESIGLSPSRRRGPTDGVEIQRRSQSLIINYAELQELIAEYTLHPLDLLSGDVWRINKKSLKKFKDIDLHQFRGDNAFIWQTRGIDLANFALSALWAERQDTYGLSQKTEENGDFGAETIRVGGRLWSRDLIDSILEISFLLDHLPIEDLQTKTIVDIGSGYGRLLHRLANTLNSSSLFGVDGIAVSTAICRAYIRHLNLESQVKVLSLNECDEWKKPIYLASNIHSFSEMSLAAVCWWLDWLVERDTKYLFIVPNQAGPSLNDGTNFSTELLTRGFELVVHRPKYEDSIIGKLALYQSDYYLFKRSE